MEAPQFTVQLGPMPRTTRTYAPGVAYHVVAVTQGRLRWFVGDAADRIVSDIDQAGAAAGHRILARTVMPNHFHIIIKHGAEPLGWMMQRVMQRAAMMVKLQHAHEGHVFQARYWAEPIPNPKYLRRAIVYTHDNPCKAEICGSPEQYRWSSHNEYARLASGDGGEDVGFLDGLMVFADESVDKQAAFLNYLKFVSFCHERRRLGIAGDWLLPGSQWFADAPSAAAGDDYWVSKFTHFDCDVARPRTRINAHDVALRLLAQIDPGIPFDTMRFAGPKSCLSNARIQLVCGMLTAGCRPHQIARLLNLSPAYISKLRTRMRFSAASH